MSTPTVDRILLGQATLSIPIVDLKHSVFQVSGSSERSGYRVKKVADPPEREILNVGTLISHRVTDSHVRGDNVIYCVADPQVMEM